MWDPAEGMECLAPLAEEVRQLRVGTVACSSDGNEAQECSQRYVGPQRGGLAAQDVPENPAGLSHRTGNGAAEGKIYEPP